MKDVKQIEQIPWPNLDIVENFEFDAIASAGTFNFHFKWLNDRWNLWVTFPDGSIREAGVYPGAVSWSGFNDFGLYFNTSLTEIDYASLLLTEIRLITWQ